MGGDHKCPVCQATFTRPQHVARHMRSHTGDRPYKCQFCGDQFARSDLLARHINKCHANEKPPPSASTGGRRKGSAAASRATTSKQACDQCVQTSLPCDGSNPCSKCISRKCGCTYVKFHRQTAPSGPGHHLPRSPSSSSSSLGGSIGSSRLPPHLDDLMLPPAPPVSSTPFSGPDQIFHTPFTFSPAAPVYPPNWTTPDMSQLPFSVASDTDLAAKYRTQTELLRRASHPAVSGSSPTMLYATQQHQSPLNHWYPAWGESATYPPLDDTKPFDGIARTHSLTSPDSAALAAGLYDASSIGSAYRPRRVSLDFSDSSSATSQSVPSSAASSSLQLPLSGSELYDNHSEEIQAQTHDAHVQRRSSIPASQPPSFPVGVSEPPPPQPPQREGGFSSAFGLMSIDDPNVLAGLSTDGVPFFSHLGMGLLPHSPNATPMPTRVQHAHLHQGRERGMSLGALPTPGLPTGKEAMDARDLKDMWKTYLRSPLSGSGTSAPEIPPSGTASLGQVPQSPSGRRRVRVSSLPSVTPTVEKGHPLMTNGHGHGPSEGASAVRTMTVHGQPDDLKSYEAAVNARNASLKLNLVPRRRATRTSPAPVERMGVGSSGSSSSSISGAVVMGTGAGMGQTDLQGISRPSSSSSSSSLAQAFTVPCSHPPPPHPFYHQNQHVYSHHVHSHPSHALSGLVKPPPMQGASISLPISPSMSMALSGSGSGHSVGFGSSTSLPLDPGSRASSVTSDGTGTGGSGSDGEVFRPSFKRYPSQTLGPASSKRALVERGGKPKGVRRVDKVEDRGEDQGKEGMGEQGMGAGVFESVGVRVDAGSPGSRPIAALPERAKRV